jgi:sporulation protein YqfC
MAETAWDKSIRIKPEGFLAGQRLLDLPRLNMIGNRSIELENHLGVLSFSGSEVIIALKGGALAVKGEQLVLGGIDRERLCLVGIIEEIRFFL